jgi:hypothetical protein
LAYPFYLTELLPNLINKAPFGISVLFDRTIAEFGELDTFCFITPNGNDFVHNVKHFVTIQRDHSPTEDTTNKIFVLTIRFPFPFTDGRVASTEISKTH